MFLIYTTWTLPPRWNLLEHGGGDSSRHLPNVWHSSTCFDSVKVQSFSGGIDREYGSVIMSEPEPEIRALLVYGDPTLVQRMQCSAHEVCERRLAFILVETLDAALAQLLNESFDAVLLGATPSDENYLPAIARIRQASPHTALVVLSSHDDDATAQFALNHGAQDYLCTSRLDANSLARSVAFAIQRQRLLSELLQQKQIAETSNKAKAELLANVSHEIRTPMTAILGFAEQMLDPQFPKRERVAAAQTIHRNSELLLEIVNDILDLSKIESGKLQVEQIRCSPAQIILDVISLLRMRAESKGIALLCQADGPLPQTICTDPMRLRQILINLVSNAVKFTDSGEVRLVARCRRSVDGDQRMEFDVCDTGIGMNQAEISRLFRAFEQVADNSHRRSDSTGLGLTISKRLAALLGGDITVSSEPGRGSCFRLEMAGGPSEGVSLIGFDVKSPSAEPQRTGFAAKHRRIAGRLLLAEDGPDSQRLLSYLLSKAGAELVVVDNGQLAVEHVLAAAQTNQPFDLILMDMQMPVMDGYTATGQLRRLGFHKPILALTAFAMNGDREKCLAAGCDDFITKPIDGAGLIRTVGQWLDASPEDELALCSLGQFHE
jgi:signal transduction histidine kinase